MNAMSKAQLLEEVEALRRENAALKARQEQDGTSRENLAALRGMMVASRDIMSLVDRDYVYRVVSDEYLRACGLRRDQIEGRRVWEILGREMFDSLVKPHLDRCLAGEVVAYEAWFQHPALGRTYRTVLYLPVLDEFGAVTGVIVNSTDITKRKLAEQALGDSEQRYRTLVEAMQEGMILVDGDERITYANPACCRILGRAREDVLEASITEFLDPGSVALFQSQAEDRKAGQAGRYEAVLLRPDGARRHVLVSGHPLLDEQGEFQGSFGVLTDITERKEVEEALARSEESQRILLQTLQHGVEEIDLRGVVTYANPAYDRLFGAEPGGMIGRSIFEFAADGTVLRELRGQIDALVREQPLPSFYQTRCRGIGGRLFDIQVDWNYKRDSAGRLTGLISIITDITESKRAQEALRANERFNRAVLDSLVSHVAVLNREGRIRAVNEAWMQFSRDSGGDLGLLADGTDGFAFCAQEGAPVPAHLLPPRAQEGICSVLDESSPLFEMEYPGDIAGGQRWFVMRVSPLRTEEGGVVVTRTDITEDKQLEETERKFRFIADSSDDFMTLISREYVYEAANRAYCRTVRKDPSEIVGRTVEGVWGREVFEKNIRPSLDRCLAGEEVHYEAWFEGGGPMPGYHEVSYYPYVDEQGAITHVAVVTHDITKRRLAEEALRAAHDDLEFRVNQRTEELAAATEELRAANEYLSREIDERVRAEQALRYSEKLYRMLFEHATEGILIFDDQGRITGANPQMARLTKRNPVKMAGMAVRDFIHPDDLAVDPFKMSRLLAGDALRSERQLLRSDGTSFPAAISAVRIQKDLVLAMVRDISERKAAEESLRRSEERYKNLFENNHVVMLLADPTDGRIMDANPAASEYYGYPREDLNRFTLMDINALGRARTLRKLAQAAAKGRHQFACRHRLADGRIRDVEVFSGVIAMGDRPLLHIIVHDITKRKLAEDAVREKEMLLRETLRLMRVAVLVFEPETQRIVEINDTAMELFCLPRRKLVGRTCKEAICPLLGSQEERDSCLAADCNEDLRNRETILHFPEGTAVPVLWNAFSILREGRPHRVSIFLDISERKALERQLAHAQKMDSIGQLAAGIAHEINTPAQYVGDNTRFLSDAFADVLGVIDREETLRERYGEVVGRDDLFEDLESHLKEVDLEYLREEIPQAIQQSLEGLERCEHHRPRHEALRAPGRG